jgi:hypothetical protein
MKTIGLRPFFLFMLAALCTTALNAQQSDDEKSTDTDKPKQEAIAPVPAAPVPAQITAAKKVFIANAGLDNYSLDLFKRAGEPEGAYNRVYAAVKDWGRYDLVASPAEADLILEVRFIVQLENCSANVSRHFAQLQLSVLDSKTHFLLWTIGEPVEGAFRKATFQKNVGQGVANLVDHMKKLAMQPAIVANAQR